MMVGVTGWAKLDARWNRVIAVKKRKKRVLYLITCCLSDHVIVV